MIPTATDLQLVSELSSLAQVHGFERVAFFLLFLVLVGLVIYVVRSGSKREARLVSVIDTTLGKHHDLLLAHDQRALEAVKALSEANTYQRQEHKEMIDVLRSIHSTVTR